MIEHVKAEARHEILMDDDGKGEAADIVGISLDSQTLPRLITVDLYHCKYSSAPAPGSRIGDMYEVCGQAQRSVLWLHNNFIHYSWRLSFYGCCFFNFLSKNACHCKQ